MFGDKYTPADLMATISESRAKYLKDFEEVCGIEDKTKDYIYQFKWRLVHYMDGKYSLLLDLNIITFKTYVTLYTQFEDKLNEIYERTVKKENE